MFYNQNIQERLSVKNQDKYIYSFIDSHYKPNVITRTTNGNGGQKFRAFFDKFCQHLFDINLTLLEDMGEFPIAYTEAQQSAQIAIALSRLTPFVMSEYRVDCRGIGITDYEGKERSGRSIDFWCSPYENNKTDFDVWIESKSLWLNVGVQAQWKFDTTSKKRIYDALKQIENIDELKAGGRLVEFHDFKVALFSIYVYSQRGQEPDINELDSIPQSIADQIATLSSADKDDNMGVLCGVLDLRKCEKYCHFFRNHYMPFIVVAGAVRV